MSNVYSQFKGKNPFGSQAKMLFHLDNVQNYLNTGDCWPIFVEFNLTDKCNLKCQWCISENCRSNDTIDTDVATTFLTDFRFCGGKAVTFSGGGEPTLHPGFTGLLYTAKDVGLDVGLMTNGVIKHELLGHIDRVCKWVRISLDTAIHNTYKKWKGSDRVSDVLYTIENLHSTKVGVNANVGEDYTYEDLDSIMDLYDKVDYIQFRPILPRYFKGERVQLNDKIWGVLTEFYSDDPKINLSNDKLEDLETDNIFPFTSCEGHCFNPVVQANGDVSVCMYHPKDPRFIFGNLYESSFREIWTSENRRKLQKAVRSVDYREECQVCCKLTELNKFMDFLNHPEEQSDINFL